MGHTYADAREVNLEAFELFVGTRADNIVLGEFVPENMIALGGTEGGSNFIYTPSYLDIILDQTGSEPAAQIINGQRAEIQATLKEAKAFKNLEWLIDGLSQNTAEDRAEIVNSVGLNSLDNAFVVWCRADSEMLKIVKEEPTGTADGANKDFVCAYDMMPVRSGTLVYLDDVLQTYTTDYTIDFSTKTVSFVAAPASGQVVEVTYVKIVSRTEDIVIPLANSINPVEFGGNLEQPRQYDANFRGYLQTSEFGGRGQLAILGDYTAAMT